MKILISKIEDCAIDLPEYNFYIKAHPNDNTKYKTKAKNIFITDKLTAHLIQNSSTVITINSTVGFESILMGKKTITLGKSFYTNSGFNKESTVKNLKKDLNDALKGPAPNKKNILKYKNFVLQKYQLPGGIYNYTKEDILKTQDQIEGLLHT